MFEMSPSCKKDFLLLLSKNGCCNAALRGWSYTVQSLRQLADIQMSTVSVILSVYSTYKICWEPQKESYMLSHCCKLWASVQTCKMHPVSLWLLDHLLQDSRMLWINEYQIHIFSLTRWLQRRSQAEIHIGVSYKAMKAFLTHTHAYTHTLTHIHKVWSSMWSIPRTELGWWLPGYCWPGDIVCSSQPKMWKKKHSVCSNTGSVAYHSDVTHQYSVFVLIAKHIWLTHNFTKP